MKKVLAVLAVLGLAALLLSCTNNPPPCVPCGGPTATPTPAPDNPSLIAIKKMIELLCPGASDPISLAGTCLVFFEKPSALLLCIKSGCEAQQLPTATPTTAPTASPTASPTPVATSTPVATPAPTRTPSVQKITSICDKEVPQPITPSVYVNTVRNAMKLYQQHHPEQFDGNFFKYPWSQDDFLWGICTELIPYGLDCIDDYPSGDLAVTSVTFKMGAEGSFAEQYHPIGSDRMVQQAPYLERCVPRWFTATP